MPDMELTLQPNVLRWARERNGLGVPDLAEKLGVKPEIVAGWEQTGVIKFNKVGKLAHVTHTPEGFLYLPEPPEERLPIPDFRTVDDRPPRRPSPDLLETVQAMQRRQNWMRDFLQEEGEEALPFVGSANLNIPPEQVAVAMRRELGLTGGWAAIVPTWSEALAHLRQKADDAGILTVVNGVVGNNTHRKLNPGEFRGFALTDPWAPLVFINGADFKAAQMFTLAHELAHIWLGESGVSNFTPEFQPFSNEIELFCNQTAAEFLVPATEIIAYWQVAVKRREPMNELARYFKVSAIVAARRVLDLQLISKKAFLDFYQSYKEDERRKKDKGKDSSGNFWNTQNVRIGPRFGHAILRAVKEGKLLYQEAYRLTGLNGPTFDEFTKKLGYPIT